VSEYLTLKAARTSSRLLTRTDNRQIFCTTILFTQQNVQSFILSHISFEISRMDTTNTLHPSFGFDLFLNKISQMNSNLQTSYCRLAPCSRTSSLFSLVCVFISNCATLSLPVLVLRSCKYLRQDLSYYRPIVLGQ